MVIISNPVQIGLVETDINLKLLSGNIGLQCQ